jgi:hypothetical protein
VREAQVRFYLDADILGLAKILTQLRADVTYPGDPGGVVRKRLRPACLITTPATKDSVWIPQVTALGWLIVTRDSKIQSHRAEVGAVREHRARMVALAGREAVDTWHQLEVFMEQWRAIERLTQEPGPFIYSITRTALRPIDLE